MRKPFDHLLGLPTQAGDWQRHPLSRYWHRDTGQVCEIVPVIAGGTTAAFTQTHARFRNDNGTQVTATYLANEDANASLLTDTNYRIRIQVDETAGGASNNFTGQLRYSLNSGLYTVVDGASSVVRAVASSNVTDEEATTAQLTAPTGTFLAGAIDEADGSAGTTQIDFAAGQYTELEYVIQIRSADVVNGDTIDFRVYRGPNALNSYAVTIRATVLEAQDVTGVHLASTISLFAGTILPGAVTVAGVFLASTLQLFAGERNATFNEIRQDILDGFVSAQSETNGWNAERPNIPVTAVVRTSDTVVTITLPALAGYDITAEETITGTVPASALVLAAPAVATPTISITETAALGVTGVHRASALQLFAGTVTTGAVEASGAHRASGLQLFAGTASPGAVSVVGVHRASGLQLFEGTATPGGVTVVGVHRVTSLQLFSGTASPGAVAVVGVHRASALQLFPGEASPGGLTVGGVTLGPGTQLFTGTVTTGPVAVVGVHRGSTLQLFSGTATASQTLLGVFLSLGTQLFSGTTTVGGVTVLGVHRASALQLFPGTATPGAVTVVGVHRGSTLQMFAGTATAGGFTVLGVHRGSGLQLFFGAAAPGAITVLGVHRGSTTQLHAGTLNVLQAVGGAHRGSTTQTFEGSLAVGPVAVQGAHRVSALQLFSGTASVGQEIAGVHRASTTQFFPGDVAQSFPQSISGVALPSGLQLFAGVLVVINPEIIEVPGSYQRYINVAGSRQVYVNVAGSYQPYINVPGDYDPWP